MKFLEQHLTLRHSPISSVLCADIPEWFLVCGGGEAVSYPESRRSHCVLRSDRQCLSHPGGGVHRQRHESGESHGSEVSKELLSN